MKGLKSKIKLKKRKRIGSSDDKVNSKFWNVKNIFHNVIISIKIEAKNNNLIPVLLL